MVLDLNIGAEAVHHGAHAVQAPCERLTTMILLGPVAFLRLHHQVQDGRSRRTARAKDQHLPAGAAKIIRDHNGIHAQPGCDGVLGVPFQPAIPLGDAGDLAGDLGVAVE